MAPGIMTTAIGDLPLFPPLTTASNGRRLKARFRRAHLGCLSGSDRHPRLICARNTVGWAGPLPLL